MENHSGDSSSAEGDLPPSAAATAAASSSFGDDPSSPPPAPAPAAAAAAGRAKLMVSYGGRIHPRPHDNQLSYVGGETKILALDRSARFAAVLARLTAISGVEDLCVKYQLPGEDLDALISVTNDEDLEHMMLEYDRLQLLNSSASQRTSGGPPAKLVTARLRVFLFPLILPPPPPSAALLDPAASAPTAKPDSQWFVDALNAIPARPPSAPLEAAQAKAVLQSPDFLFGFDEGFVPPPAVKVKDMTSDASPVAVESFSVETAPPPLKSDSLKEDRGSETIAVVSPAEIQRQAQDLQNLQIAENQQQHQTQAIHRNGSDEALTRAFPPPPEYYPPRNQEKPLPAPPPTFWTDQRAVATAGARFASIAGNGDQPVYLIPAPAAYPGASPAGQTYYALPRMVPASQLYAMSPAPPHPSSSPAAQQKMIGHQFPEGGATGAAAAYAAAAAQVAYNGAGQAVYYAGAVPTYQTVSGVVLQNPTDAVKTATPAVKPSQAS